MISSVLLFIVVLSVLVIVHEAGHFFTALWAGIKVEEFGIGFPPRAWSKVRNGIRYSLNWIPLGGFVKMKGEIAGDQADPDAFSSKPAWKRFVVLSAGVVMNLVLAAVLLSVGYGVGMPQSIDEANLNGAHVRDQVIYITAVADGGAAQVGGIAAGDILTRINDQTFTGAQQARDFIEANPGSLTVEVQRAEEFFTYTVTPSALAEAEGRTVLGVRMVTTATVSYAWYRAPIEGVKATAWFTKEILIAFYDLIKNLIVRQEVSMDLSGPVGIAVMTGEVAKMGFAYLVQFAAVLSINLAVINILPFPALDGGRIFFLLIEAVRRRPVSAKVEAIVHNLGFALLMVLVVVITYRDIVKFIP